MEIFWIWHWLKSREFISDPEELSVDCDTDHTVIGFSLHTSTNSKNTIHRTVYNFKNVDFNLLRTVIANSNLLQSVVNSSDVNISWGEWNSNLKHIIDTCIPKTIVKHTATPPWIDSEIRHVQKCKETTWRRAKTSNTESSWKKFRECRNKLSDLLKKKRANFMSDMEQSLFLNSKRFWSFYRLKQKPKQLLVKLEGGGSTSGSSASKANLFKSFFNSVFSPKMDENADLPTISEILDTRLSTLFFKVEDVLHVLVNLDVDKSVSPDSIPLRVLSECAVELAPSLNALYNPSLSTGSFSSEWKHAHITPIFKNWSKNLLNNYRPISLLNSVSKLLERLVFDKVYPIVNPLISPNQHGFIRKRSVQSQLISNYDLIGNDLDKGVQNDIIFLDFSKAFDKVPHNLLLHKLKTFGFNNQLLNWFTDYLSERSQTVIVEGKQSENLPVTSGVPQGSILGPLLFILYVNDISDGCSSTVSSFADDVKIFRKIKFTSDSDVLQNDLKLWKIWAKRWKKYFNVKKCKVMSIFKAHCHMKFEYYVDGQPLTRVDSMIDLGVTLTTSMTSKNHILKMVSKAQCMSGLVKSTLGCNAPVAIKLQLYLSHVRSLLEYCTPLWSPYQVNEIMRIERAQRHVTKFILNDYSSDVSYRDRCLTLGILPLCYRR